MIVIDDLIGKRYGCDFRIARVTPGQPSDPDRIVTLYLYGEAYEIAAGELATLIERGFVTEQPERTVR